MKSKNYSWLITIITKVILINEEADDIPHTDNRLIRKIILVATAFQKIKFLCLNLVNCHTESLNSNIIIICEKVSPEWNNVRDVHETVVLGVAKY